MNILNRFFYWVYGGYSVGEMAEVNERKKGAEKPRLRMKYMEAAPNCTYVNVRCKDDLRDIYSPRFILRPNPVIVANYNYVWVKL